MTTDFTDRAAAWQLRLGDGFDRLALERLLSLDPDESSGLMPQLLRLFEASLQAQLLALEIALRDGDAQGCRRAAHAVRSASNSLGAVDFAQACLRLELQAHELDSPATSAQSLQALQQHAHEVAQQGLALLLRVQQILRDEQA